MTGPRAIATAWMQPSSRRCRDAAGVSFWGYEANGSLVR